MPQAKPKDRPGADVSPLDVNPARAPSRPCDEHGHTFGLLWKAWEHDPTCRNHPPRVRIWIWDAETERRIDGRIRDPYGTCTAAFHEVDDWGDLRGHLFKVYVEEVRDVDQPVVDVQDYFKEKTDEACCEEHYQQRRDIWRSTWSVSSRFDDRIGGTVHYVQ